MQWLSFSLRPLHPRVESLAVCQHEAGGASFGCLQSSHSDWVLSVCTKLEEILPPASQPLSWDFAEYLKGYTNSSDGVLLKHAVAVFLLVKSPRVPCLPRHNFGLSASRRPQRNYCQ